MISAFNWNGSHLFFGCVACNNVDLQTVIRTGTVGLMKQLNVGLDACVCMSMLEHQRSADQQLIYAHDALSFFHLLAWLEFTQSFRLVERLLLL